MSIYRFITHDPKTNEDGSVYACSRDCAQAAANVWGRTLGEGMGSHGVDSQAVCDGGCDW